MIVNIILLFRIQSIRRLSTEGAAEEVFKWP
ncbi:hypothetical protein MESS2_p60001 [Mesorhizobium metallidurans STM 2683]|uniref:Uncharacterized protein n=1 Tax=Mesorhizobium metallidurans STM 2683 TaxID=1297569 RepID=M5F022_9HYPH|nr:hypothetical protein MESS2_p60001 [Mesorhizobium metallidurans STM 2683]